MTTKASTRKKPARADRRRKSVSAAGPRTKESLADRKKRARKVLAGLRKLYPDATCALRHADPFQLLVATILSAQSTDGMVNKVTPVLFDRFPTARKLAAADPAEVENIIRPTGFFRQKTKSIRGAAQRIVDEFGGEVPDTMERLLTLPGVARKTANVVLGTAFGKNDGVVVDTHVGRLATRLALTWSSKNGKDAGKIERDLMELIPRKDWTFVSHALIFHGRQVCIARKPRCNACTLAPQCPSAHTFE